MLATEEEFSPSSPSLEDGTCQEGRIRIFPNEHSQFTGGYVNTSARSFSARSDAMTVWTSGTICITNSWTKPSFSMRNKVVKEGHPPLEGAFEYAGSFLFDIFPDMNNESDEDLQSEMQKEDDD